MSAEGLFDEAYLRTDLCDLLFHPAFSNDHTHTAQVVEPGCLKISSCFSKTFMRTRHFIKISAVLIKKCFDNDHMVNLRKESGSFIAFLPGYDKKPGYVTLTADGVPCIPLIFHRHKKSCKIKAHGILGTRRKRLSPMAECVAFLESQ